MRPIELAAPPSTLVDDVERLYLAVQLPRPVVVAAREVDDFARALRLVAAPTEPGARVGGASLAAWLAGMGSVVAAFGTRLPGPLMPSEAWLVALVLLACGTMLMRLGMLGWAGRHYDPLPGSLLCWTVLTLGFLLGGATGLALGNPLWAGVGILWAGAAICIERALGEPARGLLFRWSCRGEDIGVPLGGGRPIRNLVLPRLNSAVSTALRERGYGMGDHDYPQLDRCIDAIFDRAFPTRQDLWPVLGYAIAGQNQSLWIVGRMANPPMLVAAGLAVERSCRALAVLDGIAVALLPADPDRPALPIIRSEAAGRALDALLLPWPYPTLARRLPLRWGERLAAWLIDRERDPILRFAAIERMGLQRLFEALGREPADRGPEGELHVVGTAGVPTMMLRVVDLVPNEDGSERVHWLPVPPHMVKASEAVAWTFGHSPGGYRPSMQS